MSAERWGRLVASLTDAGVEATVDAKPYSEAVYGRVQHGVSRSVRIIRPDGYHVVISDGWWRNNADVWIGWAVTLEDREGIGVHTWRLTKKRAEVVAAVQEALARAARASAVTR
jgi:hypothetical protein